MLADSSLYCGDLLLGESSVYAGSDTCAGWLQRVHLFAFFEDQRAFYQVCRYKLLLQLLRHIGLLTDIQETSQQALSYVSHVDRHHRRGALLLIHLCTRQTAMIQLQRAFGFWRLEQSGNIKIPFPTWAFEMLRLISAIAICTFTY